MTETPMPGSSPDDREVTRRWREHSTEEPSAATDARIRATARGAAAPSPSAARRAGGRWRRFVPLAAAASVALLAVGLVRLMPREEYQAVPAPSFPEREAVQERPDVAQPERDEQSEPRGSEPAELSSESHYLHAPEADSVSRATGQGVLDDEAATAPLAAPAPEARQSPAAKAAESAAPAAAVPRVEDRAVELTAQSSRLERAASGSLDRANAATIPEELARLVQRDASRRTAVDPDAIHLVSVDPVDWLDDSLGCGAPPVPAPETRVPGYRVTVDAAGTVLIYHTDGKDRIRVCNGE